MSFILSLSLVLLLFIHFFTSMVWDEHRALIIRPRYCAFNYTNPGYGLSLVDTLWNAGSYRQPLEQENNPMT